MPVHCAIGFPKAQVYSICAEVPRFRPCVRLRWLPAAKRHQFGDFEHISRYISILHLAVAFSPENIWPQLLSGAGRQRTFVMLLPSPSYTLFEEAVLLTEETKEAAWDFPLQWLEQCHLLRGSDGRELGGWIERCAKAPT